MKRLILLLFVCVSCNNTNEQPYFEFETVFEISEGKKTATYHEVIEFYTKLSEAYSEISIQEVGETDSGLPLHLVTYNSNGIFDFNEIRKTKRLILINNGIHPGESDGIDATMMLYRDLANGKLEIPKNTALATIPVYNVGGSLNRNSGTRANQNGPEAYGFRGNAQNYDLNRDFIKSDTKNARSFAEIFHMVDPDIFIDNHVSNGADYQYVLTHLFTQHNKLGGELGNFIHEEMRPVLEQKLRDKQWDITPYVNVFNRTPETGFSQFFDHPRYSTGYTTLFNTLGMMVETHMLKPYKERVEGTYDLMTSMIDISEENHIEIKDLRLNAKLQFEGLKTYPISWAIDTSQVSTLRFKGYEAQRIPSEITGSPRLKYDRSKPFVKDVNYQEHFIPTKEITVPMAYVIPRGWHEVINLLKLNKIEMETFKKDTVISVESYRISDYKTRTRAYEGHYPHYAVVLESTVEEHSFKKGDYMIATGQPGIRYLLETLEPEAADSFFNWNFFDTILQQKEGFSPYVWEDKAQLLLQTYPRLQIEFNLKKSFDKDFANNWYAQLDWLHKKSSNYEKAHLQYPIYRIL